MKKEDSIVQIKKQAIRREILQSVYSVQQATIPFLSQKTNISVPTLTEIMDELIHEKWIRPAGTESESKAGRKARIYEMHSDSHYTLIIEIDTLYVRMALFNFCNSIIGEVTRHMVLKNDPATLDYILGECEKLLDQQGIRKKQLSGIGISMPGLVNAFEKVPYSYLNFPDNLLLKKISGHFDVPVIIDNDLKAMVRGEHNFGQLKNITHALVVNADFGVGVGMILDGKVYHGSSGFSGELGHIPVKNDGDLCYCGKRGCLETVVSVQRLIERSKSLYAQGNRILREIVLNDSNRITIDSIIASAEKGDEALIDLLSDTGYELGKGLATVVHLLNPARIVISGSIARAGRFILHPVEEALNKYCISRIRNDVAIEISQLGNDSKIFGMHSFVVERVMGVAI